MAFLSRIAALLTGLLLLAACAEQGAGDSRGAGSAAALPPLLNVQEAGRPAHPLIGRIWVPGEGREASEAELARHIAGTRFVLIGEKHDNPDHHRLQAGILAELVRADRRPAVVWEMIDFSREEALQAYLARPGADAAGLGDAVGWADSGWPEWETYRPIAEVAMAAGLPQRAANFDRATVGRLMRDGLSALSDPVTARLLRVAPWSQREENALNLDLVEGHCGVMPERMLAPMNRIQRSRDAAMAAALLQADAGDGAVLIAGNGHVRADRGVPIYLGTNPDAVSIGLIEAVPGETGAAAYIDNARQFDFVIFTALTPSPDRCAGFGFGKE